VPLSTISACRLPQRGADQPFAPIEHGLFVALPSSHLGGVGLDLRWHALHQTIPAPDDQPDAAAAAFPSVIGGPR